MGTERVLSIETHSLCKYLIQHSQCISSPFRRNSCREYGNKILLAHFTWRFTQNPSLRWECKIWSIFLIYFHLKTLGTNHLFQKFIFFKLSHILFFCNIYIFNETNRFSSIYNIFIFDTNEVTNLSLGLHWIPIGIPSIMRILSI